MKHITHLIPATSFIEETHKDNIAFISERYTAILNYARFLQRPLEIGMFVPAVNGIPLKEPLKPHTYASENADHYIKHYQSELTIYQEAKSKVLFEGFELDYYGFNNQSYMIKDNTTGLCVGYKQANKPLINFDYFTLEYIVNDNKSNHKLKLTPAALKEIYNT